MEDTLAPPQTLERTPAGGSPDGRPAAPPTGAPRADADHARWGSHPVNIRLTVPLLFRSYYITVLIGPERRSRERRAIERKKHPLFTLGNVIVYFVSAAGWALFLFLLYRLVSLGI